MMLWVVAGVGIVVTVVLAAAIATLAEKTREAAETQKLRVYMLRSEVDVLHRTAHDAVMRRPTECDAGRCAACGRYDFMGNLFRPEHFGPYEGPGPVHEGECAEKMEVIWRNREAAKCETATS